MNSSRVAHVVGGRRPRHFAHRRRDHSHARVGIALGQAMTSMRVRWAPLVSVKPGIGARNSAKIFSIIFEAPEIANS